MKKAASALIFLLTLSVKGHGQEQCRSIFVTDPSYRVREVMDISRTDKALTYVAAPKTQQDILEAISFARKNGLKVTVKGTNHSHGGHNRRSEGATGPEGIQLDMVGFNKILSLDTGKSEVTVQSGVTWKDLAVYLNEHGLATMTEQSSNIFSVGGSISTNVHGRDIHGPLINSISSIKFIDAAGNEKMVSREIQPEVFRAMIGGYGAFGVITEATLRVEKNYLYEAHSVQDISVKEYVQYMKDLKNKPSNLMHYGRVNIAGKTPFQKVSYTEWKAISDGSEKPDWKGWQLTSGEKNRWVSSMIMNLMRYKATSGFGKYVKDAMDKLFGLPKTGTHKTKNNIMNNPVQFLFDNFYNKKESVDILQEYFLPLDQFESFLSVLNSVVVENKLDLMNVTMRYVPKIARKDDSLLSPYSDKEDVVAVVLYFNITEAPGQNNGLQVKYDGSAWTQQLIQGAQNLGGTFYWPYHRWWNPSQIKHNETENILEFFKIKDTEDPGNMFESDFLFHLRKTIK